MAHDRLYARLYMLTRRLEYFATPPSPTLQRQIEVTKTLLDRIQSFCRQNGSELVVLSIPQQFQVLAPASDALGVDVDAIDHTLAAFAAERDLAWLAALPTFREVYRPRVGICSIASMATSTSSAIARWPSIWPRSSSSIFPNGCRPRR